MNQRNKPFRARVRQNDDLIELGYFATSEECEAAKNEYYRMMGDKVKRCITASQTEGMSHEDVVKVHLSYLPSRLMRWLESVEGVLTVSQIKRSMRRTLESIHPNQHEGIIIDAMTLPEMLGIVEKIEGFAPHRTKWKKVQNNA